MFFSKDINIEVGNMESGGLSRGEITGLLVIIWMGLMSIMVRVSDATRTAVTTTEAASAVEAATATATETTSFNAGHKHAYATMMYMGTPRDYEFYVATRVMLRSLLKLGVEADLVVIASLDVPPNWVKTL